MFIEGDKLPDDVLRKQYSDISHALCCLECGYEAGFNPLDRRGYLELLQHDCPTSGD